MRYLFAVLLSLFLAVNLYSRDIKTLSGTTYKDVTIYDHDATEIVISFKNPFDSSDTVMKSIPFKDLPDDIRKEFKYDPAKAEAIEKARQVQDRKPASANTDKTAKPSEDLLGPGDQGILMKTPPPTPVEIGGGTAPGEKEWKAEGRKIRRDGGDDDLAPGEKEDLAEDRKIERDGGGDDIAPGEKEGLAEGRRINRDGGADDIAPGEKEWKAEDRKIFKDGLGDGRAPGEK